MRYLMVILMTLIQLSLPSASRAENDFLGLDADLANFASGVFLYQQLSELEPAAGSADLFTKVRTRAETALHRHKLKFLALSVEQQAGMIDQIRNITNKVTPAKLVFPGDATRNEVYRNLLSWGKGRLSGLIEEYKTSLQIEIREQKAISQRISKAQ
jgi:hypothetical protein